MPKGSYGKDLYVLWIPEAEICKVGRSSNCARRLKEIRAGVPWLHVELACVLPDAGWIENTVHGAFRSRQVGREWFKADKAEVIKTAGELLACLGA